MPNTTIIKLTAPVLTATTAHTDFQLNGLTIVTTLRNLKITTPILMISALSDVDERVRGLRAGGDDYLVKPFDLAELSARIGSVARRYGGNPNPLITHGPLQIDLAAHRIQRDGTPVQLTAREGALLEAFLARPGQLLSKARFLFMAAFQERFADKLIAEMRGFSDEAGRSPFWESLGRHFFSIDFSEADYLTGIGQKSFIAELMPKHPLYVDFLSPEARESIGQVHPHTAPARAILESEGMKYEGYVDIFDAGPTLEAYVSELRAVKQSRVWPVVIDDQATPTNETTYLLANDKFRDYRALLAQVSFTDTAICLPSAIAAALGVTAGDTIRAVTLFSETQLVKAQFVKESR